MSSAVPLTHDWAADNWDWPLQNNDGVVKVTNTPEKFEVGLSAVYFTPNEIQVSVVNNELVVNAKHELRSDEHGTVAREVHRSYKLPHDIDQASLKSHMSKTGTLVITANKKH